MKKIYIAVILIVISLATFLAVSDLSLPSLTVSPSPSLSPDPSASSAPSPSPSLIRVEAPINGQLVKSPLVVKGEARGYWYFEASFPIKIYDANGIELGVAIAQANGEWMTEDFVPFDTAITFKKPATETGTLVLEKDNPSGLPEHDAQISIDVRFDLENWPTEPVASGGCVVAGCSGQLCVDESEKDTVTTCEYRNEYACYQTAQCGRQENGQCGWTPTEELVRCLGAAFQAENP